MTRVCWPAAANGGYWLDIALGTFPSRMMLDTGIVDPQGRVAFDLDPALFDVLEQFGQLLAAGSRTRHDASGNFVSLKTGFVSARLLNPATGIPFGPTVRCLTLRNFANVVSRVGVVFFHHLTGCRADWDFDNRRWCVECP